MERKDAHIKLDCDVYEALKLFSFVSGKSRDNILNNLLIRTLPSEIECLLSNESSENPFREYETKLESLIKLFEKRATEFNRRENP